MRDDDSNDESKRSRNTVSWKVLASIAAAFLLVLGTISNITMYADAQNSTESSAAEQQAENSTSTQGDSNSTSSSDNNANATSTSSATSAKAQAGEQQATNITSSEPIAGSSESANYVTISGEALQPSSDSITRSFSYPTLMFEGDVLSEIEVTITWNPDGTIVIKIKRGYELSLAIPRSQGNVTLFSNSTVVDQRLTGSELSYDTYWFPVTNADGYIDRYEFIAAGDSRNATSFAIDIANSEALRGLIDSDSLAVGVAAELSDTPDSRNRISEGNVDGLILDWSDAIESGAEVRYDTTKSEFIIPVNKYSRFFVDPYIVASTSNSISPSNTLAFQDQLRLFTTSNDTNARLNAFYYDGSNIVYKTSDDHGDTWSSVTSLGTGVIASNNNRWSITPSTSLDGTNYVHVFYWTISGSTTTIKTLRGEVSGLGINWGSPVQLSTITNNDSCGWGACVSVSATSDIEGTIHAAFIWNTTGGTFSLVIKKSTDSGLTWSDSLSQINGIASNIMAMTLSELDVPGFLFTYAKGESASIFYRVYNGSIWGSEQAISSNGMQAWTRKQLSSIYHEGDGKAYVAYTNVTTTNGGILKLARFFGNGTFDRLETADSTLRHYTPNILPTHNGDININSIADGMIYNTRKFSGAWEAPFNPYGMSFDNPDDLTATTVLGGENAAIWREGTSAPYNLVFGLLHHGLVEHSTTVQNSPAYTDYSEGQRRVASNANLTLFAFYYDGSNIVYKKSFDLGHSWSASPISTGSGSIASDSFRWTIAHTTYNGTDRITLLYYQVSGSNTNFYATTFKALDSGLVLVSTANLFSAANDASCSPTGTCAAASGSSDVNLTLFAAFRWKSGGNWQYRIMKSSDGGSTWSASLNTVAVSGTANRVPITITGLDSN